MALPVFALLVVAEVLYTRSQGRNAYALKDFAGSMSQLGINSLVRLAIGGALISLHFFLYQFRVFEVPNTTWGWIFTFVVIDFFFLLVSPGAAPGAVYVVCPRGASLE